MSENERRGERSRERTTTSNDHTAEWLVLLNPFVAAAPAALVLLLLLFAGAMDTTVAGAVGRASCFCTGTSISATAAVDAACCFGDWLRSPFDSPSSSLITAGGCKCLAREV
uniref:Uncharacterized protein n=1 Tax=Anopheles melas TaxID=34690 RepID=A0A182TZ56_9DIPT